MSTETYKGREGKVEVTITPSTRLGVAYVGYMEHDTRGELGGLWFDELKILTDYDGVSQLSMSIIKAIQAAGFRVPPWME
jgi:hypothetical protein